MRFRQSVNHASYLRDDSGGRRFWPIACGRIDIDRLALDRANCGRKRKPALSAAAFGGWRQQNSSTSPPWNKRIVYVGDPWEEVIARWAEDRRSVSIGEVLSRCLDKPQALWTQVDKNRVVRCFRALGWELSRAPRIAIGMALQKNRAMSVPTVLSLFAVGSQFKRGKQKLFPVFHGLRASQEMKVEKISGNLWTYQEHEE